jgi:hypothetical protein
MLLPVSHEPPCNPTTTTNPINPTTTPHPTQLRAQCEAEGVDSRELSRRLVDLVVVSVLLDAGAGDRWRYTEEGTGQVLGRSEGLGVSWWWGRWSGRRGG